MRNDHDTFGVWVTITIDTAEGRMANAWRLARSLEVLRDEIRAKHPGTTVWTIGDQAHASGPSDHNPNASGVVCAIDVLGDKGLNLAQFAEHTRTKNHPAWKYTIFNRRIISKARLSEGWRPYSGSNPHTTHVHVSVGVGSDGKSTGPYDNTSAWGLATLPSTPTPKPNPQTPSGNWTKDLIMALPTLKRGSKGTPVKRAQALLRVAGHTQSAADGDFGPQTDAATRAFQKAKKIGVDGIIGKNTWTKLLGQ